MFNTIQPVGNWIQVVQTIKLQNTSWVTVVARARTVAFHKCDIWHVNTNISPWGLNALPYGCCGVGASAALAQLLEKGEFDQACRKNRKMSPVNAYVMKLCVCSVGRTPLSQSSKVSWGSLHWHRNKLLFHEVGVHMASGFGSPPPTGRRTG